MGFQLLVELMNTLRGEKGCPWDKRQTLGSLRPFLIEEAYEVIEAMEQDDTDKLKEELGDLLFHILFISKVCADRGTFDIQDVIQFEYDKMRRRHPHVFGPDPGDNPDEVLKHWYELKREERAAAGKKSLMDGIPRVLPALQKAQKVQRRAAEVGFDWEKIEDVLEKISEEVQELKQAISRREQESISEEMGDLLFSMVNVSRFLRIDAEQALREAVNKFSTRFRTMEQRVAARGKKLADLSLREMDAEWDAIKAEATETSGEKSGGDTAAH
jgi:tetrapyrrole methylase family protein/MazG family protein